MLAFALVTCLIPASQDRQLLGVWAGGFQQPDEFVSLELHVSGKGRALAATVVVPERGFRVPAKLERAGDAVSWSVAGNDGVVRVRFRGRLSDGALRGKVTGSVVKGEAGCDLIRIMPLARSDRARLAGTYRADAKTLLRIVRVPRGDGECLGIACAAWKIRSVLYPLSENELVAGTDERPLPRRVRIQVRSAKGGAVERLEVTFDGRRYGAVPEVAEALAPMPVPQLAPGLAVERREVTIDAGDVRLAGTLYLPPGVPRPCPAAVQLHGSAPTRRSQQWFYFTSVALRSGLAVLAFDKRGCGASTGKYRSFTVANSAGLFDELASDGAAAHAWLRKQKGIDPGRVGLVGGSQAGWIMPLIADKTPHVRFIVSACGPPVSAGEESFHERRLKSGVDLATADREVAAYDGPRGYDPRKLLRRIETPILWLFGERDTVIPTRTCLQELAAMKAKGIDVHDVHVFRDGDHNFATSMGDRVLLEPVIRAWLRRRRIVE